MHHSHQHHPPLVPPLPSSTVPLRHSYVHQYSYNLPGSGSFFKMSRVYNAPPGTASQSHLGTPTSATNVPPFLPSFVGGEQFRSSFGVAINDDQFAPSQIGRLKEDALLSSLSFLPDGVGSDDDSDVSSQPQNSNNSSGYHNPRFDPFNPRYNVRFII